ncbi:hypothetical protein [Xenorhabdus bovienii]|nr:hypothetical protein [Xenorhabdus bovienii]MDE9429184.1 hypothetical protein [Xenorhabdus bovienii]MDE9514488.1 hypothetical protein [Xenorhabdus bovienii]
MLDFSIGGGGGGIPAPKEEGIGMLDFSIGGGGGGTGCLSTSIQSSVSPSTSELS